MDEFIKELKKVLIGHGLDENTELRDELISLIKEGIPISLDPDKTSVTCGNVKYECDGSLMGTAFSVDDIIIAITSIELRQAVPMAVPEVTVKILPNLKGE